MFNSELTAGCIQRAGPSRIATVFLIPAQRVWPESSAFRGWGGAVWPAAALQKPPLSPGWWSPCRRKTGSPVL